MSNSYGTPQNQRPARDPKPIIYSICIPRVFKNISEKRIRAILYSLKFGFVERVDMVAKTNKKGDEFWRVFVHFSSWNEQSGPAHYVKQMLDRGEQVPIVYDDPWYWMLSKSKVPRPEQRTQRGGRPAPFIDFSYMAEAVVTGFVSESPPPVPQSPDYMPHTPPTTEQGVPMSPSNWPGLGNSSSVPMRSPSPEPNISGRADYRAALARN